MVRKVHHNTELWTIDGEPLEFKWNITQDLPFCSSATDFQEFLSKMSEEPEEFTGRIIFMSMREDFHQGDDGHSSDLDQKRSGISNHESEPQGQ